MTQKPIDITILVMICLLCITGFLMFVWYLDCREYYNSIQQQYAQIADYIYVLTKVMEEM